MALEFTSIPDRIGPAIYILTDGTTQTEQELTKLGQEIDARTPEETQVVLLDPSRGDGLQIKEFYAISAFPTMMIVMDDDTVPQMWSSTMPQAEEVSYMLSQITGSLRG